MTFSIGDKVKYTGIAYSSINSDILEIIDTYGELYVCSQLDGNKWALEARDLESCQTVELVDHPVHYKSNGMEAIDVIEAFDLGFNLGNVVKYVLRCGKKDDDLQELKKALWYLQREIDKRSK